MKHLHMSTQEVSDTILATMLLFCTERSCGLCSYSKGPRKQWLSVLILEPENANQRMLFYCITMTKVPKERDNSSEMILTLAFRNSFRGSVCDVPQTLDSWRVSLMLLSWWKTRKGWDQKQGQTPFKHPPQRSASTRQALPLELSRAFKIVRQLQIKNSKHESMRNTSDSKCNRGAGNSRNQVSPTSCAIELKNLH